MIFVFGEDHTLEILSTLEEVENKYDAFDVECKVFEFFDENGHYLKPKFVVPNKTVKKWFIFNRIVSGKYKLELSEHSEFNQPLDWALGQTIEMRPNAFFNTLNEAKRYITSASTVDK